jgi:hypothetical protein
MGEFLTVSGVAEREGVRPRDVSDLLYGRKIDVTKCPLAGRIRLIPCELLPDIRAALAAAGKLPAETEKVGA